MRQLAAIMFADMTGYTALMQQNEQLAKEKRKRLKGVLETSVSIFNGKILQYYGDGSLSIFNSAIDSVNCAIEIQQKLQQELKVEVRIGLHIGDVSIEEESIYGDGVNIASRIESLAVPGSVFISEKVYDEIRNQDDLHAREMGYFELKNVRQPIRVFAIDNKGLIVPSRDAVKGKTSPALNRLAVLPFVNMSTDPENEYFSDGITEELLNALTKVDGLQVTSRTSAFAFKGKNDDIREIAARLNVDKVLEGSVRKSGNRVRITAQLINAVDGYHIWSENYDRDLTDIFTVQDEISSIIANKLRENLSTREHVQQIVKSPTKNVEAYTLFLKGLHFHNKLTPEDTFKAIQCYEEAIALEPGYAQAYARVAAAYAYLGATGQLKTDKAFEIVHRYSEKALRLDNSLADGHVALGSAYLLYDMKWKEAYESFERAIELNPAATGAYQLLSFYHTVTGNKEEAVRVMETALRVDPLSPMVNHYLANAYMAAGRYDDALRKANEILDIFPKMRMTREFKGWVTGLKGDWEKALEIFLEVQRQTDHPLKGQTPLAYAYGKLGLKEKAMECISNMQMREDQDPNAVLDSDFAVAWWGMGDKDKAIDYLFTCIDNRLLPVALLLDSPIFHGLSAEPQYPELKRRLGLVA